MRAPYLPLSDIARIYRISPRTARRWAQHDHWRRTGKRPIRYNLSDAQDSYENIRKHRVRHHLVQRYGVKSEQIGGTAPSANSATVP